MEKLKITLVAICTFFASLLLGCSIFVIVVFNSVGPLYSNIEIENENTLSTDEEEIKILQLTDVQFSSYTGGAIAFHTAKKVIEKTKPDLIVLTGDNVTKMANKGHVKALIKFMDSFKIPWALVYGNHDYEAIVSIEKQSELYENSEYCIFKRGVLRESQGNYYYNLKRNGETIYSLIFMNSHKEGFINSQVNWYEETIDEIRVDHEGNLIPSILFFHIPLLETKDAYNAYLEDPTIGEGKNTENIGTQKTDVKMFDKIKELGSTKYLIYGHDHENYSYMKYEGVTFSYGVKTGKTSYFDRNIQGGSLYTIMRDNTISIDRIFI